MDVAVQAATEEQPLASKFAGATFYKSDSFIRIDFAAGAVPPQILVDYKNEGGIKERLDPTGVFPQTVFLSKDLLQFKAKTNHTKFGDLSDFLRSIEATMPRY